MHMPQEPAELFWHQIQEPGAYLEVDTGHLYRIPGAALSPGSSPIIKREGTDLPRFVRISKDPFIPRPQALVICYDHGFRPRF